jgi:hypothetical protein
MQVVVIVHKAAIHTTYNAPIENGRPVLMNLLKRKSHLVRPAQRQMAVHVGKPERIESHAPIEVFFGTFAPH